MSNRTSVHQIDVFDAKKHKSGAKCAKRGHMGKINVLDASVFNMLAAGEVVERPSSVVKELIENSIDAGATVIDISLQEGGTRLIEVSDNGVGIAREDICVLLLL